MKMKVNPIQKVGSANVVNEVVTVDRSNTEPLFRETTIPATTPITMARTVDDPKRIRVFTSLPPWIMSCITGL
jgi:hypothetical protein